MVDASKAMESLYLTAKVVEASEKKQIVIVDGGGYEDTDYGERLTLTVQIDGKSKIWRPNRDSVKNISGALETKETDKWVGKSFSLQVVSIQGKDSVIATKTVIPDTK